MIVVIADDFTGASELGGIGVRYGLNVEIQTDVHLDTDTDLLIIDTNSRSLSSRNAKHETRKVVSRLQKKEVDWLFKKTDSVMRGHILEELEVLIPGLGKKNALLVPASPSFGRTISDGKYFIKNKLLHETAFSRDPEYPALTSDVLELLGHSKTLESRVSSAANAIYEKGIIIGEVQNTSDLKKWAPVADETIPAGSAEFFAAILESRGYREKKTLVCNDFLPRKKTLLVCGSSLPLCKSMTEKIQHRGFIISQLPCSIFNFKALSTSCLQEWTRQTMLAFQKSDRVMVSINQPVLRNPSVAHRLAHFMTALVEAVFDQVSIHELLIEGGSTASSIVRQLGFDRLIPQSELTQGVVRMRPLSRSNQFFTVKPGSYEWPDKMWN